MLFSIEQSILAEETLANLWSLAKSANVSTLQSCISNCACVQYNINYYIYIVATIYSQASWLPLNT